MEEEDEGQNDDISEDMLRQHCGLDDLTEVEQLDFKADGAVHRIETLGQYLPNLRRLRLSNSSISCMRDLGTALINVEVLWMSQCGLRDLDGVTVLSSLTELYIPFNEVADVSQLKWLDDLAVLDLEGNAVSGMAEVAELRRCRRLLDLSLSGNPVCCEGDYSRNSVLGMLPQVNVLDGDYRDGPKTGAHIAEHKAPEPYLYLDLYQESGLDLYLDLFLDQPGTMVGEADASGSCRSASLPGETMDVCAGEPDEPELVIEWLKRPRPRPGSTATQQAFTARAAATTESAGFSLDLTQSRTLGEGEADQGPGSELTRGGGSLAGAPLAVLRRRRRGRNDAGQEANGETSAVGGPAGTWRPAVDPGIRKLLRRHRCAW